MLKRFDFYLLKEILSPFFVALLAYSFVLLMNQLFLFAELLISRRVELRIAGELLLDLFPAILAFTIPMASATGAMAATTRLSSDWEILAMKTLGISLKRLARPFFIFAFICWLITSAFTLFLAPRFNDRWVRLLTEAVVSRIQFQITPREFNESIPETMLFIENIDENNLWSKVFVFQVENDQLKLILARQGKMNVFPEVKKANLELAKGEIHLIPLEQPQMHRVASFERHEEEIDVTSLFPEFSRKKRVREKDILELFRDERKIKNEIRASGSENQASGSGPASGLSFEDDRRVRDWRSHQVEIHKRFSLPFVCFLFAFLALPLGISTQRGGRTSGFTLSLVIILIYYILITGGEKAAVEGRLPAWLGLWGPNLILLALSFYLFIQESKEEKLSFKSWRLFAWLRGRLKLARIHRARRRSSQAINQLKRRPFLFPSILDRYLIRQFLFIFSLVFLALLFIFVIITIFERLDNLYEHNKPLTLLLQYTGYRLPEFLMYILPLASLTTTLLSLGLLEKKNETTAVKASGISLYRLMAPLLLLAIVVCAFSFYLQEYLSPYASRRAEEIWNKINDVPPRTFSFLDRRWVMGQDGRTIYHFSYFDPIATVFYKLHLFRLDTESWQLLELFRAEKASLVNEELILLNGWERQFKGEGQSSFSIFKELRLQTREKADYFTREWKEPAWMNWRELRKYIQEIEKMGFDARRLKVDLQGKVAFPLVSLVMVLIGIPFAFMMGRRGVLVGVGLSLILALLYWSLIGFMKNLGYVYILSPFLAVWAPNLLFGSLALFLIARIRT
jgi:LPS export ABC transporter permease LptG/LPS export ABC transporter permease LptF